MCLYYKQFCNMSDNWYFIKAPCHQGNRPHGFQLAPEFVKKKYDYEIDTSYVFGVDKDNNIKGGYDKLYQYILNYTKLHPSKKIVTVGGDHSVAAATIAAMNEKYIEIHGDICTSRLKVLYIDRSPDLETLESSQNLDNMVVSSLFGIMDPTIVKHKQLLNIDQILYIGLKDDDGRIETVSELGINFLTLKKINQIGVEKTLEIINDFMGDSPIHISLDMKVFNKASASAVIRDGDDGISLNDMISIFNSLKNKIESVDIVEFNPLIPNTDVNTTKRTIQKCLSTICGIKEKTINIFNEDSEFLIYRPLEQVDPLYDYGWYIMRGLSMKDKKTFLEAVPKDTIISVTIDEVDYLVTKTSMNEQNKKSCYVNTLISDTVLFPNEKVAMCFELINSSN